MAGTHQILIVEDHPIYREGLKNLLASGADFELAGEAQDGLEAVERAKELQPELILMDLSLPQMGGIEAIAEIKRVLPDIKILAITVHEDEEYIAAALRAGADGYVLKDADRAEVIKAIRTLLAGKSYLSPSVSDMVIRSFVKETKPKGEAKSDIPLTPREQEVLKLVAEGHTNKGIAERLFLSVKTVERHRANIMSKLDLHNPQALTAYAIKKGLLTQ